MKPELSIKVFGVYLLVIAVLAIFVPAQAAEILRLPPPADHNGPLVGVPMAVLGYYYLRAARAGNVEFMQCTVPGRLGATLIMVWMLATGILPIAYFGFPVVECASALWTAAALRRQGVAAFRLT